MAVYNSGDIDSYVRMVITKNWGKDATNLNPAAIQLGILTDNGWIIDSDATTDARVILYYRHVLERGKESPPFMDSIKIDPSIQNEYEVIKNGNNITIANKYDNSSFYINVEVNVVQTHSAVEAIRSAWGIEVSVDENGMLTLL